LKIVKDFKVDNRKKRILSKEEELRQLEKVPDNPPWVFCNEKTGKTGGLG